MKTNIHRLHRLKGLSPESVELLEAAALLHRRHAHIFFEILKAHEGEPITIAVRQDRPFGDAPPCDGKRLHAIGRELLKPHLPEGTIIHVHARPYTYHPIEDVDVAWVNRRMQERSMDLKQLRDALRVERDALREIFTGDRDLSPAERAMFYYYFVAIGAVRADLHSEQTPQS